MTGRRISIFVAAIFGCAVIHAADNKVELKGSTEVELPKPKRTIDTDRRLNDTPDRPSDGLYVAPGKVENSPLSNKKLRHELDRQKNWIFQDPQKDSFDRKSEEFMKGEKGTGLYSNRFMQSDDDRTMVQKFLEKDRDRNDKDKDEDNDRTSDRSDRVREKEGFLPKRDEDEPKQNNSGGLPKAQFDTAIFKAGSATDPFGGNPLDNKMQRNPFGDSTFSVQRPGSLDKDELRKQQVAHEQEFNTILRSRPGSAASLGKIDTLTPGTDVGRVDLGGGVAGRRSDPYSIGGGAGPTIATFTDGGPTSFGNRAEIGARSFSDNLPSFAAPRAGASFAPAPVQIAPDRASAAPPPVAPSFPMRKF